MPIYKISDLNTNIINQLLRERNLDATGVKAVFCSRLIDAVKKIADEFNENDIDQRVNMMQNQIETLTATIFNNFNKQLFNKSTLEQIKIS